MVNSKFWGNNLAQWNGGYMDYANTKHPFTGIQITEKGLDEMAQIVNEVRSVVGYEIPLSSDHYGHFDLNNAIGLEEKWNHIAWPGWKIWFPGNIRINTKKYLMHWKHRC